MDYLYHAVPLEMSGTTLYPLNVLKLKYPSLYQKEADKYAGRETVMQKPVPILDCLWNDVLHFSAVHPAEIKKVLIEAGFANSPTRDFYQVNPRTLSPEQTVIYLYSTASIEVNVQDFIEYDPTLLSKLSVVPPGTKAYYKEMFMHGMKPLRYHLVPHILYRGVLDVTGIPIISV